MTPAYQAYATGACVTSDTPSNAALEFFETFPNKRKCTVTEGHVDGQFFVRTFNLREGRSPRRWENVTKKMAPTLEIQS